MFSWKPPRHWIFRFFSFWDQLILQQLRSLISENVIHSEFGKGDSSNGDNLSLHCGFSSFNKNSVLADHVENDGEFAGIFSIIDLNNSAYLYELGEGLC